jgi:hypothetical protein
MVKLNAGIVVGVIAAILCLVGSFLPWAELNTYSIYLGSYTNTFSGLDGDGVLTLLFSIIVLVVLIYAFTIDKPKKSMIVGFIVLIMSVLMGYLSINANLNLINLNSTYFLYYGIDSGIYSDVHSGHGLWFVEIGSFVLFIVGIYLIAARPVMKAQSVSQVRHCPGCGRPIPMDANICPYCAKDFITKKINSLGEEK